MHNNNLSIFLDCKNNDLPLLIHFDLLILLYLNNFEFIILQIDYIYITSTDTFLFSFLQIYIDINNLK